jgi:hypothetical protein
MPAVQSATDAFNRDFLEVRAKLLEVAAAFDRWDRAEGSISGDHRIAQIRAALAVLGDDEPHRAERLQLVFSLPYEANWKQDFKRPQS